MEQLLFSQVLKGPSWHSLTHLQRWIRHCRTWVVLFHEPASGTSLSFSTLLSGSSDPTRRWLKCYLKSRRERLWHLKTVSDNCRINPRQIALDNHFITGLNKLIFERWSSRFGTKWWFLNTVTFFIPYSLREAVLFPSHRPDCQNWHISISYQIKDLCSTWSFTYTNPHGSKYERSLVCLDFF